MKPRPKLSQLQIRVSEEEKAAIRRAAERAGMDMSSYVLERVISIPAKEFQGILKALAAGRSPSAFALADLNSLLSKLAPLELADAIAMRPAVELSAFPANYVAAMVESACAKHGIPVPTWTRSIAPLDEPVFGSGLKRLRLHLLTHAPAAFRRRNVFIDSSLGDRV
ncbi:MAG TPA: DUF1778 domain-containing protein [Steroidobacteraceae bacterium]|nr:DUF1778 domain-containing protein [Steroidobacteraceae bacterium]